MNVPTIAGHAAEAKARLEEYRAGLAGREPTDEDRGVMLGLAALAKGKSVLDLNEVFRNCPPDAKGRPALAVARAHWRHMRFEATSGGTVRFYQGRQWVRSNERVAWHRRIILPGVLSEACRKLREGVAIVPMIPPNLRPAKALYRYCILFEAEWEPVPPTDPMLIRHLHGSLYVVLGVWDLTPLEKAVLAWRLNDR